MPSLDLLVLGFMPIFLFMGMQEFDKKKFDPEKGIQDAANVQRTRGSKGAPKDKDKAPLDSTHSVSGICT